MKKIFALAVIASAMFWTACSSHTKGAYIDLRTGKSIEIEKDPVTGAWINADTKEPVYIYVNTKNNDTIYGKTGVVINGHVVKNNDNVYWYDGDEDKVGWNDRIDEEYKYKSGDYKEKVDADGDVKIKDGDKKIKIDGETGEKKVKD